MCDFSDLNTALNNGRLIKPKELSESLRDTKYFSEEFISPKRCPVCDAKVRVTQKAKEKSDDFQVKCVNNHIEKVPAAEMLRYSMNYESWFDKVAEALDTEVVGIEDEDLPKFVWAEMKDGFRVTIIISDHAYDRTVRKIIEQSVRKKSVNLLLTPKSSINDIYDCFEVYSVGSLVCPYPFGNMDEPEVIKEILYNAMKSYELSEEMITEYGFDDEEYLLKADKNPMLVVSELNYMEILRRNKELSPGEEERLEKVVTSAFSHLGSTKLDRGGDDDSGKVLPDNVARLSEGRENHGPTLCLVDTKSGKDASFSQEEIERKHKKYVKRAKKQPVFDSYCLSHIFLVFDIDGHQEIRFYDEMKKYYDSQDAMIVIFSQALGLIMEIYNSAILKNEIKLSTESFTEFIEPFFNKEAFYNDLAEEIKKTTRFDQDESYPDKEYEKYRDLYLQREQLIVVTTEMVKQRFSNVVDQDKLERVLDAYFSAK